MILITFDRINYHHIALPLFIYPHRIELYFSDYSDDIDISHGFYKVVKLRPDEYYRRQGVPIPEPKIVGDYSQYKYKWNVLTPMTNGIVLTDDPNYHETEDDHFKPHMPEDIERIQSEIAAMVEQPYEDQSEKSDSERIADLEAAVEELKANQNK